VRALGPVIVSGLLLVATDVAAQAPGTPVVPGRCDFYAYDGSIRRNWYCVEGTVETGDGSDPAGTGSEALLYSYCEIPSCRFSGALNSGLRFFSLTGPSHIESSNYSHFCATDSLGLPLYPEQHCRVAAVEQVASRSYYLNPPHDAGGLLPGPWFFGNVTCGPDGRPESEESCSGSYDIKLFARYGSAKGRVGYAGNQPVADGYVVASDLLFPSQRYVARTDDAGNYTFTKTDAAQLPVVPPDPAHPATPIRASNNWGLPVFGDGGRPGVGLYVLTGGPVECPEGPQSRLAVFRSSQATDVNLRSSGANCDGCPLPEITEITDPVAQRFEDEAAAGREPVDRDNLTAEMREGLECFERAVRAAGGDAVITSAYRPTPYQKHLVEIWRLNQAIMRLSTRERALCQEPIAAVVQEMRRHRLAYPPARVRSRHEDGEAFDARPPAVDLDAVAASCGLQRRVSRDSVHFERVP